AAATVDVIVLEGTVKKKQQQAEAAMNRPGPVVLVMNYEAAWREPMGKFLLGKQWDLVVLDESHRAKSGTGKIGRFVDKLRLHASQRLCLSGTPAPHSPLDLFSQMRFLDVNIFGRWFTHFRSRYAIVDQMFPSRVLRWI